MDIVRTGSERSATCAHPLQPQRFNIDIVRIGNES